MTIRACREPFGDGLVLTLEAEDTLALHGEIVSLSHAHGPTFGPTTQRLLTILERALVGGDLTEFAPYDWEAHPADCPARAGSVYYCECGTDPHRSRG